VITQFCKCAIKCVRERIFEVGQYLVLVKLRQNSVVYVLTYIIPIVKNSYIRIETEKNVESCERIDKRQYAMFE